MIIVSNTGPILHLYEAQLLDILPLTGTVYIPPIIEAEIKKHVSKWRKPDWLKVVLRDTSFS